MGDSGGTILALALVVGIGVAIWKRCDLLPSLCKPGDTNGPPHILDVTVPQTKVHGLVDVNTGASLSPTTVTNVKPVVVVPPKPVPQGAKANNKGGCKVINGKLMNADGSAPCASGLGAYTHINSRYTRLSVY